MKKERTENGMQMKKIFNSPSSILRSSYEIFNGIIHVIYIPRKMVLSRKCYN